MWLVWVGWAVGVLWSKFELVLHRFGVIYRVWLLLRLKVIQNLQKEWRAKLSMRDQESVSSSRSFLATNPWASTAPFYFRRRKITALETIRVGQQQTEKEITFYAPFVPMKQSLFVYFYSLFPKKEA